MRQDCELTRQCHKLALSRDIELGEFPFDMIAQLGGNLASKAMIELGEGNGRLNLESLTLDPEHPTF
jgi:hypothetical protein